MDVKERYSSRKFIVLFFSSMALILLPILYAQYKISDETLHIVLYGVSGLSAAYTGFNVLQKKISE